jgi:hypothetical protein
MACGSDSHPPGVGDGVGGTDAGNDTGGAGGRKSGGGTGAKQGTTDGGITLDGGDAGGAGRASAGGGSSRDGGAGGAGSGGRPVSDGGPVADANLGAGGSTKPMTMGELGTGSVACNGVAGNACGAGTACCAKSYEIARECVSGFADCSCFAEGSCPLLGCDGPEDCPGARCCATTTMDENIGTTWCKKDCEPVEQEVCKDASDCSASGAACALFGSGIMTCS